ncbi:MAG: flagellar hook-associated protein FlgK, partial [Burkholderiales bacterium]|nr:flagellar hook-associated protein FlgK [Burkholderiales bacterium]
MSIFQIGVSGLNAAQAGLLVTSHNITNASKDGYHRQEAIQGTQVPLQTGSGFFGQGVTVETVRRAYSQFLDNALLQAEAQASYLNTYGAQIRQIDNMLADPTAGLSPTLQAFFSGVQDVASNPSSVPSRQQLISLAQGLVARFQSFDARFTEMRGAVNRQISDVATEVTTLASAIASVNERIIQMQGDPGKPPNDLLDERDALVTELNKLVRVSTIGLSDGSINVFIGNGQSLVLGAQAFRLEAGPAADNPQDYGLFYVSGGNRIPLSTANLQGGTLGGLFDFRTQTLDRAQNQLGLVATVLAQTFNDQHALGMDLEGNLGGEFFAVPQANVVPNQGNGSAVLAASNTNVGALTGSDYRVQFVSGAWTVTRLNDGTQNTFATLPQTIDGVTISVASGTVLPGDSFLVQPTRNGARDIGGLISDTAKIAAAAPVRTEADIDNIGKATISAGVVVDTGNAAFATAGQLTPPILIRFTSATQYSIYNNTNPSAPTLIEAGITYTPGTENPVFPTPGSVDHGYRVSLTGAAAAGDEFTVGYNTAGVSDNRNALLLAGL